jgi:hypothetical protein
MAKKTAPKKKAATVKTDKSTKVKKAKPVKVVKVSKPAAKIKEKSVVKPLKTSSAPEITRKSPVKKVEKPKVSSPLKKPLSPEATVETKKKLNVVSMLEADVAAEEPQKVEKISKVKPVKVERGNVADEKAKWAELYKKYGKEKAIGYKMTEVYPSLVPLQHKVLGWGFILTNDNDRLEVLFENGIRMLISNYKPG